MEEYKNNTKLKVFYDKSKARLITLNDKNFSEIGITTTLCFTKRDFVQYFLMKNHTFTHS